MDPRIRITLNIIEERKGSIQFDLSETSMILGLSEAYLRRLFHRETGRTFHRYMRETRMARATELLKGHARSIKQIAVEAGYSDVSNFYRDFKSVYGVTPREARFKEWAVAIPGFELTSTHHPSP
jgi:AraC-like DNA-binding protein